MSPLFEDYEQQYSVLTADITSQIGRLSSGTGDRRELINGIDKHVEEAQELLEQMELESREADPSKRAWFKSKLDCYRAELKRLVTEFNSAKAKTNAASNFDLIEEYSDAHLSHSQRQKLLDNSERIERSGKKLEEGYRIVLETEEIGNKILQDLDHQRETIQHSRSRVRDTNEELNRSSRVLNLMIMRSMQQRVLLYIVAACFVVAICLGIYLSFNN